MKARLYNLFALRSNGSKCYLTSYPMTHRECEILASKCLDVTRPKIQFEEVNSSEATGS